MFTRKICSIACGAMWCISCFYPCTYCTTRYIDKLYCSILGKDDASCKYKDIAREALLAFGVKEFDKVPVKKMGNMPLRIIGNEYVSFTMQGIWLNENVLAEYPEAEVVFILYHEAAHYAYRDHAKQLVALLPAAWLFYAVPHWSVDLIKKEHSILRIGYIGIVSALTIGVLEHWFMSPVARYLEKNADIAATRALCKINRGDVVLAHIEYLQSLLDKEEVLEGSWSYPLVERINYVSACYKELMA